MPHSKIARLFACFSLLLTVAAVQAAPISYGDFTGATVKYTGVTENSGTDPTPLYGSPDISGNTLDFDPVSFNSYASGAGQTDVTDGTLKFNISALTGSYLDKLLLSEQGDVTLAGFGGLGTFGMIRSNVFINILAVDGVSINPVNITGSLVFNPSNGSFDLLTNGAGGPFFNSAWSGSGEFNLTQALIDNHISYQFGVTQISVTLDNTLATGSESGTAAYLAKKDFQATATTHAVPEVSSVLMLSSVVGSFLVVRKARRLYAKA